MAFPATADLGTKVVLNVGGVWTDITPYAYLASPITIARGRADEGARADFGRATIVLRNDDGRFCPRNPLGPYYGRIGRNTPLYVSVQAGSSYLSCGGDTFGSSGVSTPDTAALDVVGDIDVRIDATLDNWVTSGLVPSVDLAGKFNSTGNQRSWLLQARDGAAHFEWSADGTTVLQASSTVKLPIRPNRRLALRVTLQVNNGAAGSTVTFYTSTSLASTWKQLGDPVVTAGATSIFNSTAPLRVGEGSDIAFANPLGQFWGAEIRSGIGGTVVANPVFTGQTPGAASFVDGTGKTWTVGGNTSISNERVRFYGEVSSWPTTWGVSGQDVRVSIQASGILRRLGQGAAPLSSTLRRRIPSFSPLAYWPMEEAAGSTQAYSPIKGVRPMRTSGFTWAADASLAGSAALPTVGSATTMSASVPAPSGSPTSWHAEFVYRLDAAPTSQSTVMRYTSNGTVALWTFQLAAGTVRFLGQDSDGTTVVDSLIGVGSDLYDGRWNRWEFYATVSGGTVTWNNTWVNVGGGGGAASGTYTGSLGRITGVQSPPNGFSSLLNGMRLGHIAVFSPSALAAYVSADTGFLGETAGVRMGRLSGEESVPLTIYGDTAVQEQMGPQRPATTLELIGEAADVDGGILYEQRAAIALAYRDRNGLYNQAATLALDYTARGHVAPPLEPTDDDQLVRNDITVTRVNGSSARATLDTGTLSTLPPPDGVGVYDDSVSLNLATDDQTEQHASWRLHTGTWDEARYPSVKVLLHKAPGLIDDASGLDSGDIVTIANPPAWLPPDGIGLMVRGYTEVLGIRTWDITFNTTPAGPWSSIGVADTDRADTAGSQLAAGVTATATALSVTTTSGPVWVDTATHPDDFPFAIRVGGEVMTAVSIAANVGDGFNRTVTAAWGTADSGQAWTTTGGAAADYSVQGV